MQSRKGMLFYLFLHLLALAGLTYVYLAHPHVILFLLCIIYIIGIIILDAVWLGLYLINRTFKQLMEEGDAATKKVAA